MKKEKKVSEGTKLLLAVIGHIGGRERAAAELGITRNALDLKIFRDRAKLSDVITLATATGYRLTLTPIVPESVTVDR